MSGIQVDKESLVAKKREIDEMDVVLDAQSGSKSAGKRAVINSLETRGNTDFTNSVVDKLLENFEDEELIATYFTLVSALEESLKEDAEIFVDARVKEGSVSNAEKLSDAELVDLAAKRKSAVEEFKALKNILEMFGQDVDDISVPKTRRGSRGPRGPRTLSKYQYQVNETVLEPSVNSLSTVAKLCGHDTKVKELRTHIESQGIDLKSPPAEWEAELPHEVGTLKAYPLPEYKEELETDDDEDDSEDAA